MRVISRQFKNRISNKEYNLEGLQSESARAAGTHTVCQLSSRRFHLMLCSRNQRRKRENRSLQDQSADLNKLRKKILNSKLDYLNFIQ